MAMTDAQRDRLITYCRLVPEEMLSQDYDLLEVLNDAAVAYLQQSGISQPPESTPRAGQYDLLRCALVLDAYDRRDRTITGTIVAENPSFRQIMTQMKLTEPVSNSDTGLKAEG